MYIIKKVKDSTELLDYLISEEEKAIDDYRTAITETKGSKKALDLYSHILQEEIEHLNELKLLKQNLLNNGILDSKVKDGLSYNER